MKQFTIWQWTDYVRRLGEGLDRSAMETHLSSGCPRCRRTVKILSGVALAAQAEARYEPPEHAMRYARAVYSLHRPEKAGVSRLTARLVHDSFRDPLPAGMRAQNRLSRQALYEAGTYYLDLQLEHQAASGLVTLIGQVADRNKPATSTANVPVMLIERKTVMASTLCDRFGAFPDSVRAHRA